MSMFEIFECTACQQVVTRWAPSTRLWEPPRLCPECAQDQAALDSKNIKAAAEAMRAEQERRAHERGVTIDELRQLEAEEDAKQRHEFMRLHGYDPYDPDPDI
jgi:hypothetical protein